MSINKNLRALRTAKGMTQEDAANQMGLTRQAISSYESGRTQPDLETLMRLAEVYGTDLDAVLYGLDYSSVALIISDRYEDVYRAIDKQLDRGVTFLEGRGGYTGAPKTVLMTAVKSRQISELKQLVQCIDPNAFMIVQPAHQVLGEGFKRYNDDI